MVALGVLLITMVFIFILCCLKPRGGPNSIGAFKNLGQLRPVSIESSNHYSQFANEDYSHGHMPDHMMPEQQDQEQAAKQKNMRDFDQEKTTVGFVQQSWSPEHGEWVSGVCVCVCVLFIYSFAEHVRDVYNYYDMGQCPAKSPL